MTSQDQGQMNNMAEVVKMITALYNKYSSMPNVQQKLIHHITDVLPTILETTVQQYQQREERKKSLEEKSDEFIEEFLAKTRYFYHSGTELFFIYSGDKVYEVIKEDNIQHSILTTISASHKDLMPWKYKIKIQIIKRIRENNILKSIPESETIQNILRLLTPALFHNKDTVKYFLTTIGDILHKKNSLHYFINSKTFIPCIKEISQECYKYFGINLLTHFKFKYYEHANEECRLINVCDLSNGFIILDDYFKSHIIPHIIDLLCVASHYSTRYVSADLFLEKYCNDYSVINHALYLKNNTNLEIVARFIHATTEECPGYTITYKNLLYLWKIFIEEENIPNIFFNHSLQELLSTHYEELNLDIDVMQLPDNFENTIIKNRTSKHLPFVCSFMSFWNTYIIDLNNTKNNNEEEDKEEEYELELEELLSLFNKSIKRSATTLLHNNVSDKMLLGLIKHFYPDIIIEDDKYLIHVGCRSNIWNKRAEIEEFIKKYKESKIESANANVHPLTSQSLYTIYQSYCKYAFDKEYKIISKRWFEKYFISVYNHYLIDTEINANMNIIVSSKWFSK
jgi:hypothetical protein